MNCCTGIMSTEKFQNFEQFTVSDVSISVNIRHFHNRCHSGLGALELAGTRQISETRIAVVKVATEKSICHTIVTFKWQM